MKSSLIILLSAILLAGCAQTPPLVTSTWDNQQTQLAKLNNWTLAGKIAFITPHEKRSLNIHWSQSNNDFDITLSTFLGSTVLKVHRTPLGTEIIDNDGQRFSGDDAEMLIEQLSGFLIPIDVLQQWIKGNPAAASYQLNEQNQVINLSGYDRNKAQWSVNFGSYKSHQQFFLPHKIELEHADFKLKFSIAKWQLYE